MHITSFREEQLKNVPVLKAGYIVRVHQKITDVSADGKEKQRIQIFEGQVIGTKGGKALNGTVTVRKISSGVGVERIFPIHSPNIEKIEVIKATPSRKAKIYFTRNGQEARVRE
ncbi:MAG: 50S ribosomal protein L19 [Candidatus Doudnabacteria bacterium]|nr:50S ribosomal protein L19 [Candidatus Doudnabacteria bacterium]